MPDARITGDTGTPVLLLPGGAASSRGFFPGLVEALPGHRVVELDRPGTGLAQAEGVATLASGSAAAAQVLRELNAGPAVVVGQSLGGALAQQVAADHPDLVAGLVLIDPTPLDQPRLLRMLPRLFGVLGLPGRVPVAGPTLDRALWALLGGRASTVHPSARPALQAMLRSASVAATAAATRSLAAEGPALVARQQPLGVPVVLLTADRKPGHAVRRSHDAAAQRLGARVVAPVGAVHAEHLRDPAGVRDLVLEVIGEVLASR